EDVRGAYPGPVFLRIRRHGDVTEDRLQPEGIYSILKRWEKLAGLKGFAPHDLRRTFASAMFDTGADIVTVKDAMGHASVTTTAAYDRRGTERLKKAREMLKVI
ncbi:tyrosine-type recombinase/integrase, partial [Roseibium sp. RKSG952]|uniref:tyrosine-type recombinase/integrase n=1 Tax=Roseibium sp. RKSG952 TaxID=2529384 RepID=UPI0012BCCECF